MLLDLRESVPEVDLDVFFDRGILPDLRDGLDAQTVFNNMKGKEDGVLYKYGRWKAFATTAIMQKRGHEDDVYGSLVVMCGPGRARKPGLGPGFQGLGPAHPRSPALGPQ